MHKVIGEHPVWLTFLAEVAAVRAEQSEVVQQLTAMRSEYEQTVDKWRCAVEQGDVAVRKPEPPEALEALDIRFRWLQSQLDQLRDRRGEVLESVHDDVIAEASKRWTEIAAERCALAAHDNQLCREQTALVSAVQSVDPAHRHPANNWSGVEQRPPWLVPSIGRVQRDRSPEPKVPEPKTERQPSGRSEARL